MDTLTVVSDGAKKSLNPEWEKVLDQVRTDVLHLPSALRQSPAPSEIEAPPLAADDLDLPLPDASSPKRGKRWFKADGGGSAAGSAASAGNNRSLRNMAASSTSVDFDEPGVVAIEMTTPGTPAPLLVAGAAGGDGDDDDDDIDSDLGRRGRSVQSRSCWSMWCCGKCCGRRIHDDAPPRGSVAAAAEEELAVKSLAHRVRQFRVMDKA